MSLIDVRERVRLSPLRARPLLTVRAAISSARFSETPRLRSLPLMCSYWRARLVPFLTPRGGMSKHLHCRVHSRSPTPPRADVKAHAPGVTTPARGLQQASCCDTRCLASRRERERAGVGGRPVCRSRGEAMSAAAGVSASGMDLLVEAGSVLATSLDLPTTMGQVARLTVPRLADLCVIDMQAPAGSIREVAIAAADQRVGRDLEALRERFPLDPQGDHPVARVIRSGDPLLLADMSSALLESFAQGAEHASFMLERQYRSA